MVPYLQIIGFVPYPDSCHHLKQPIQETTFGWIFRLGALAVFTIVQIIQDALLVPKIMGKITGLNPAIILLVPFHLGFFDGNAGNDHRSSACTTFNAFVLSALIIQRKDIDNLSEAQITADNQDKNKKVRKIIRKKASKTFGRFQPKALPLHSQLGNN